MRDVRDTLQYREKLRGCSVQELEDIYFHIHILKHPDRYRAVLAEMELRQLRPQIADRPLPDLRWNLQAWMNRLRFLSERPLLSFALSALITLLLSFSVCLLALTPFWLLIVQMKVNDKVAAFVYAFSLPLPALAAWHSLPPYGRKKIGASFVAGVVMAYALFNQTGTYREMVKPLVEAERSMPAGPINMGFGGF